jgi:hypothetical protein
MNTNLNTEVSNDDIAVMVDKFEKEARIWSIESSKMV